MGRVMLGNLKRQRESPIDVRVDRSSESPLGNPFDVRAGRSRDAVCEACDEAFEEGQPGAVRRAAERRGWACAGLEAWDSEAAVRARRDATEACARRVAAGHDVRLMCHCYPRRCHAQDLARRIVAVAERLQGEARRKRRRRRGGDSGAE